MMHSNTLASQNTNPRLLIFGFSNVASNAGFATPLKESLAQSHPNVDVVRVGLGALQPHVVPPLLREALIANQPVTHVLLEVMSSAFSSHPLATEALGRELVLDCIQTVVEFGAQPLLMMHYRNRHGKQILNLNELTHRICADAEIGVVDLADALIAEKGVEYVHSLLKDDAHTTPEGSQLFAEQVHQFLMTKLDEVQLPAQLGMPQFRRRSIPLKQFLPDAAYQSLECFGLAQSYAKLQPEDEVSLDLGGERRVSGLSFMYHGGGGHTPVWSDTDEAPQTMTTIDPFSYFPRIGFHAFRHYVGRDISRIKLGPTTDASEVTLLNGHLKQPLHTLLGSLFVMEPSQQD